MATRLLTPSSSEFNVLLVSLTIIFDKDLEPHRLATPSTEDVCASDLPDGLWRGRRFVFLFNVAGNGAADKRGLALCVDADRVEGICGLCARSVFEPAAAQIFLSKNLGKNLV